MMDEVLQMSADYFFASVSPRFANWYRQNNVMNHPADHQLLELPAQ
jgi:hypothetical protein